jgi:hypothetical protein
MPNPIWILVLVGVMTLIIEYRDWCQIPYVTKSLNGISATGIANPLDVN